MVCSIAAKRANTSSALRAATIVVEVAQLDDGVHTVGVVKLEEEVCRKEAEVRKPRRPGFATMEEVYFSLVLEPNVTARGS